MKMVLLAAMGFACGCGLNRGALDQSMRPAECASGVKKLYAMEAMDFVPAAVTSDHPHRGEWEFEAPNLSRNLVLHVCVPEAGSPELLAVAAQTRNMETQSFLMADKLAVSGLAEALAGDPSRLRIVENRLTEWEYAFTWIQGWSENGQSYVTLGTFYDEWGKPREANSRLVVGRLVEIGADLFPLLGCVDDDGRQGSQTRSVFSLGSAEFTVDYCRVPAAGETTGYRIVKVRVKDSNPELSPDARLPVVLEGEELERALQQKFYHHNAGDWFTLELPWARYAAVMCWSGMGFLGGTGDLPDCREVPDAHEVFYRVNYNGAGWQPSALAGIEDFLLALPVDRVPG